MFFSLIAGLALPVIFIVLLVLGTRRLLRPGTPVTAVDVRQLFQFVLMYGLTIVVAIGASELVGRLLGAGQQSWDPTDTALAQALSFLVVGGILLALLAIWTWRSMRRDPQQENTAIYTLYLTAAALTALAVAAFTFGPAVGSSFGGDIDESGLATVLVWGLVWLTHWVIAEKTLTPKRNTPHLLLGSVIAVVLATTGFVLTIQVSADLLNFAPAMIGGTGHLAAAAGTLIAGALVWLRYWVTRAQDLPRTSLWMLFTLPLGVGGGLVLALGATGAFLWELLVWFLGVPGTQTAQEYFNSTAGELALALAGFIIWWYFRATLGERVSADPVARRTYLYLMSGIGLGTAAIGGTIIVGAFIESLIPAWRMNASPVNWMLGGVVLLVIGAAVWLKFWARSQKLVSQNPSAEEHSQARRIYLLLWIWGGGVAAAIALIVIAVQLFQMLISGVSFQDALYSSRYAVGALLIAITLSVFHGLHYKAPPEQAVMPRSVTLIGNGGTAVNQLREQLGSRVSISDGAVLVELPADLGRATEILEGYAGRDVVVLMKSPDTEVEAPID